MSPGGGGAGSTAGAPGSGLTNAAPPQEKQRGPTARELLRIDWKYPVYVPAPVVTDDGRTVAQARVGALSLEEAFAELAGDDPRPLLVLRECLVCNGTDDALLKAEADNEKTILLSRWFHCVKLPVDVMLKEEHPFHALFAGESPPHLFVADADGSNLRPLESERSRTELWDVLRGAIERSYVKDSRPALKQLARLLDRYDVLDQELGELEANLESTIEKKGPDARKVKKLRKDLEELKAERAELDAEFEKASKLELRAPAAAPAAPAGAGAGAR